MSEALKRNRRLHFFFCIEMSNQEGRNSLSTFEKKADCYPAGLLKIFRLLSLEQLNNIVRENKYHQCQQEHHTHLLSSF